MNKRKNMRKPKYLACMGNTRNALVWRGNSDNFNLK